MTPDEQKLAKRVHNQRVRLRQLECFIAARGMDYKLRRWYRENLAKCMKENRRLKDQKDQAIQAAVEEEREAIERMVIDAGMNADTYATHLTCEDLATAIRQRRET